MAFADVIFTAATPAGLQPHLNSLYNYLQERGLEANARKCRTLTIAPSGKHNKAKIVTDRNYTVVGTQVALSEPYRMKRYKYLIPDLLTQVNPNSSAVVAAATMSYQGTWAKELVTLMSD
ncbi:hypothetical protein HPB52_021615 [Rhipicephalus sanguineus]|uniref:Uncharacterized protein n=1 Tax=Rhipicephalus sanguineus TaxID=34632 RepID=A0A9D4T0N4_RHISA|nr:hypothetical protein HPB52_021615 [Rhipicephalus sanguineus]